MEKPFILTCNINNMPICFTCNGPASSEDEECGSCVRERKRRKNAGICEECGMQLPFSDRAKNGGIGSCNMRSGCTTKGYAIARGGYENDYFGG